MTGFTIPDNDVAAFPIQAQIFELDIEIMAGDAGWVVSGCEVTPQGSPDMSVHVAAGIVRPRGMANVVVAADDLSVDAADATLWRIDLISASDAGVATYTAGTAAPDTAVKPPARPADHVGLAFVLVPPAGTAIDADLITDKRNLSDPGVLRYLDHGNTGASEDIFAGSTVVGDTYASGASAPSIVTYNQPFTWQDNDTVDLMGVIEVA